MASKKKAKRKPTKAKGVKKKATRKKAAAKKKAPARKKASARKKAPAKKPRKRPAKAAAATRAQSLVFQPSEAEIRVRAHALWIENGRRVGHAREEWLEAERQLIDEMNN